MYFEPGDAHELAERLSQVLDDGNLRDQLSERGLARAQLFTWDKTAEQTVRVYQEAITR